MKNYKDNVCAIMDIVASDECMFINNASQLKHPTEKRSRILRKGDSSFLSVMEPRMHSSELDNWLLHNFSLHIMFG